MEERMKYFCYRAAPFFLLLLSLLFFGSNCGDFLSDFQDEEYEVGEVDEQAARLHASGEYINVSTVDFKPWIYKHVHKDTLASLLTDPEMKFDTTDGVIDTIYQFTFDTTVTVDDDIHFELSHGEEINLIYDTTYSFTEEVEGPNTTYNYLKIVTLSKTYVLSDYYIITTPSEIDTLPVNAYTDILDSLTVDSVLINQDTSAVYSVKITKIPIDNYICLEIPPCDEIVFFYTDYVNMALHDEMMQEVPYISNSMPMETYSFYSKYESKEGKVIPYFKERFSYELTGTRYFLRIDATEQTSKTLFELAVVYD